MENILQILYAYPSDYEVSQEFRNELISAGKIKNQFNEQLKKQLTEEQYNLLDQYLEADAELRELKNFHKFSCGLHFGIEITKEILYK